MIDFQIVGLNKVKNTLQSISPARSKTIYQRALQLGGEHLRRFIVKRELSGQILKRRSGNLAGSIRVHKAESGGLPAAIVRAGGGSKDVKYAGIQERGGIVQAKRAKFLAIPTQAVLTGTGRLKKKYDPQGGSLRNMPAMAKAFVIRTKSGRLWLVKTENKKSVFLFQLVKSVNIKPHFYMQIAATKMKGRIGDIIVASINRQVRRSIQYG